MNKKIDVYYCGKYLHSTNSFKTCKEARQSVLNYLNNSDERLYSFKDNLKKQLSAISPIFNEKNLTANFDHSKRGRQC